MPGLTRPIGAFWAICGLVAVASCNPGGPQSYQQRRASFTTTLTRHGPRRAQDTFPNLRGIFGEDLPGSLEWLTFPGAESELKAWLYLPAREREGPAPALLFLHAGWELVPSQQPPLLPFMEAGYVVMWPTFRAEHGNPGDHEMLYGEVEDAAAAARWLAERPAVDAERVYALGWSSGGGISALLSLWDDVPLRHTASSGGLYESGELNLLRWARVAMADGSSYVPFDTTRIEEFELRALPGNFQWMKRPHFAFFGTQAPYWTSSITAANQARARGDTLIRVIMVPGDHHSIFPEVVRRYLQLCEMDRQ